MPYNPQYDLRGKRIEDTYQQVVQYDTGSGNSYNGQGAQLFISASFVPNNFPDITDVPSSHSVGINQTLPQTTLDVGGDINASGNVSASSYYSNGGIVLQVGPNTLIETIGGTSIFTSGLIQLSTFSGVQVGGRLYNDNGTLMLDDTANTSSVSYVNGFGGKFGVNTTTPKNALDVVGNISCSVITASLNGTASQAVSASWAPLQISASWSSASLFSLSSSFASQSLSSSWTFQSISSSYINGFSSSAAPVNQTTASAWMSVTVNGLPFFLPLYQ